MPTKVANGLDLQNQRIQNVGTPSANTDAASKSYVDAASRGAYWKDAVRVALAGNINIASPGATLDGVTMASGNRVLLMGQTTGSQNGIYIWNGASTALTRAVDADENAEVKAGLTVTSTEGTTNADKTWRLITDDPITVGTTSLAFTVVGGASTPYTAGNGLQLSGEQFSTKHKSGGGILADTDGLYVDAAVVARRFVTTIGDGSATSIVVTHNLNATEVDVALWETSSGVNVIPDVSARAANTVTLAFGAAPASGALKVKVTS